MLSAVEQQKIFHLAKERTEIPNLAALNAAIHAGDVSALQGLLADRDSYGVPRLDINLYRALGQALCAPSVNEAVVGVLLALKDREGYPIVELNQTYGPAEETVIELVLKLSVVNPTAATFDLQYRLLSALLALQNRYGQRAVSLNVHSLHQPLLKQALAAEAFACFQLLSTVLTPDGAYALPINEIHRATTVLDLALLGLDRSRIDFIRALGGQQAQDVMQARVLPMARMINTTYVDDAILLEDAALDDGSLVSHRVIDALPIYAVYHVLTATKQLEALTTAIHALASQHDDLGHHHAATLTLFENNLAKLHRVFESQAVYVQECSSLERQRVQKSLARDVDVLAHNYRQFLLLAEVSRAFLDLQVKFTPVLGHDYPLFTTINTLLNTVWQSLNAMTFNPVSIDTLSPALHACILAYKNSRSVTMGVDDVSWLVALDRTMHQAMALHARLPVVFVETAEMIAYLQSDRIALKTNDAAITLVQVQFNQKKADLLSRYADALAIDTEIDASLREAISTLYHEFVVRVAVADVSDYLVQGLLRVTNSALLDQIVQERVFNALDGVIANTSSWQEGDLLTLKAHSQRMVGTLTAIEATIQLAWAGKNTTGMVSALESRSFATLIQTIQAVIHGVETVWSEKYWQEVEALLPRQNAITQLDQVLSEEVNLAYNGPRINLTTPNAIPMGEDDTLPEENNALSPTSQMLRDMSAALLSSEWVTDIEGVMREVAACFSTLWQEPDAVREEGLLAPTAAVHQTMRTLTLTYEAFENAALNLGQDLPYHRFD